MTREFDVLVEQDEEGYYVASVPALRGCHTQARSLDELACSDFVWRLAPWFG
jgi:predicted RNase H-like HicB family nuclease